MSEKDREVVRRYVSLAELKGMLPKGITFSRRWLFANLDKDQIYRAGRRYFVNPYLAIDALYVGGRPKRAWLGWILSPFFIGLMLGALHISARLQDWY